MKQAGWLAAVGLPRASDHGRFVDERVVCVSEMCVVCSSRFCRLAIQSLTTRLRLRSRRRSDRIYRRAAAF